MPKHISVKTLDQPEFINLTPLDINPGLAKCEIKVLYLEGNRNRSWISKDVAANMAKTLRGAPIVGYFKESKEDFADHGEQVIIDDEGIKFKKVTRPYGFVAPDAEVWFQNFEETDEFGNKLIRTYLMTTGYMWLQQYPEGEAVINEGRSQSMELDPNKLSGNWSTNINDGVEYFIISDAVFQALCVLGKDVEPCFEGSTITKPDVSASFTKVDDNFTKTLYTMMQELQVALQGGQQMNKVVVSNHTVVEPEAKIAPTPVVVVDETEKEKEAVEITIQPEVEVVEEAEVAETVEAPAVEDTDESSDSSFACGGGGGNGGGSSSDKKKKKPANSAKKDEKEKEQEDEPSDKEEEPSDEKEKEEEKEDDDKKKKKDYALLETQYEELKTQFSALQEQNQALIEFKNKIEAKEKEELINSFYMLSDEDKKDVIDNISNYTLEEIESKLAVKCLKAGIFSANKEEQPEEKTPITTYSLDSSSSDYEEAPEWIAACIKTRDNRK